MEWIVFAAVGVVLVAFGIVAQWLGWADFRGTKDGRSTAGNVLAPIDSLFAPTRQEAMQELERQTELPAPAPTPGDGDKDIFRGNVKIDLTEPPGR